MAIFKKGIKEWEREGGALKGGDWKIMQKCTGILGNIAKGPQHYSQFHPDFVQHDPLLHLQNQGKYFNNGVNHTEQYREKVGINKA